jgi:hypothetical protein
MNNIYQPEKRKPRLLDLVSQKIQTLHYSRRTEKTYIGWIKRFILFHRKRHPVKMGEPVVIHSDIHLPRIFFEDGYDIRTVQELLAHKDVQATMIYTHVLNRGVRGVLSPADRLK